MSKPRPATEYDWTGHSEFRCLASGITIDPPGAVYGPRKLSLYEFVWIMEGEAVIHFDKQVVHAKEGMVLFRRSGVSDYYEWSTTRRTVHAYVHFDLNDSRKAMLKSSLPIYRVFEPNDIFRPLFGYLLKREEKLNGQADAQVLQTLDLMLSIYTSGDAEIIHEPAEPLPQSIERVTRMIRSMTSQVPPPPLQLKQLAMEAHTSPENLCRLFKKHLNLAPLKYVKLAKLDRAASQLRLTSLSLKEIALNTGFYDTYHLSRSFKEIYGLSPMEFRKSEANAWLVRRNPIIRTLYTPAV
jgi:AraC family transcriptional regulator